MPQGGKKFQKPAANAGKKKNQKKKGATLKKGARFIAPKKGKLQQAARVKKGLEAAIKNNIEQEMKASASKEGKPFKVVENPKSSTSKKNKKS